MSDKLNVVRDKYYTGTQNNYMEVSNIGDISIEGLSLKTGVADDGRFVVFDDITGFQLGSSSSLDRAIENTTTWLKNDDVSSVRKKISEMPLSPRYSRESLPIEDVVLERTRALLENKDYKRLYEQSWDAYGFTRKALTKLLGTNINAYNATQLKDFFVKLGYDPYKAEQDEKNEAKRKEQAKKEAARASQDEYRKRKYPFLDLSNMSDMNFARLDTAMQKRFRFRLRDGYGPIKTLSDWIKDNSDAIVGITTETIEETNEGKIRTKPLILYQIRYKEQNEYGSFDNMRLDIPKLAYDNWIGFGKSDEAQSIAAEFSIPVSEAEQALEIEGEHLDTLEKVASGELTPEQAVAETVKDHLEESKDYYDEDKGLPKMERELEEDSIIEKFKRENIKQYEKDDSDKLKERLNEIGFDKISLYNFVSGLANKDGIATISKTGKKTAKFYDLFVFGQGLKTFDERMKDIPARQEIYIIKGRTNSRIKRYNDEIQSIINGEIEVWSNLDYKHFDLLEKAFIVGLVNKRKPFDSEHGRDGKPEWVYESFPRDEDFTINSEETSDRTIKSLCEKADFYQKTIHATVADEDVERYERMGFGKVVDMKALL